MARKKTIFKLVHDIHKGSETAESYNTGLIGENIIVSAYNEMPLNKLIKMRYIINKLIKKKKEFKRVNEHNKNKK